MRVYHFFNCALPDNPTHATALVKVLVGVGKEANKYKLTMTVDADNGEIHQLAGTMAVKESAA